MFRQLTSAQFQSRRKIARKARPTANHSMALVRISQVLKVQTIAADGAIPLY